MNTPNYKSIYERIDVITAERRAERRLEVENTNVRLKAIGATFYDNTSFDFKEWRKRNEGLALARAIDLDTALNPELKDMPLLTLMQSTIRNTAEWERFLRTQLEIEMIKHDSETKYRYEEREPVSCHSNIDPISGQKIQGEL